MYEGAIQDLIDELGRLPGIGPKSAQRIAFHIIQSERVDVSRLVDVLRTVKERVKFCTECGNISEEDLCRICRDPRRDATLICVVEESKDVMAIEKTREFRGKYHVLAGQSLLSMELGLRTCESENSWSGSGIPIFRN